MIRLELEPAEVVSILRDWAKAKHPELTKNKVIDITAQDAGRGEIKLIISISEQQPNIQGKD